jgi:hypothetical protein
MCCRWQRVERECSPDVIGDAIGDGARPGRACADDVEDVRAVVAEQRSSFANRPQRCVENADQPFLDRRVAEPTASVVLFELGDGPFGI